MRICWIINIILISFSLQAQAPKFYAKADAKKILNSSFLTVEFILENAEGTNFQIGKFNDFTVTGGPSTSSSMQIINGKVSQSKSYIYELTPKRTGKLTVPSATIYVKGKPFKSKPITIEVIKGNAKKQKGEDAYIKMEVSDTVAYVGQQITLDYKLYTRIDIRGQNYLEAPEYNGFFAEEIRIKRTPTEREIIDGQEYYVKVLERIALFPQQTGNYTLGPVRFKLRTPTGKTSGGFFNTVQTRAFVVQTAPINILVKDFDVIPPSSFSGAIGKYTYEVKHQVNSITQDDAFTFRMTVRGDGDSRTINAPKLDFGPDLDVYDPNTLNDVSTTNGVKIINEKVFEYIVVPKKTGRFKLEPEFSYYDIDSSRFETIRTIPINLAVAPGTGISKIKEDTKISKVELAGFAEAISLKKKSEPLSQAIFLLSLLGLGLPGLIYIIWQKKKQLALAAIDPNLLKSNLASSVVEKRLAKADALINSGSIKEGFAEISNALKEYLSDKYQIPYSDLNNKSILNLLEQGGLDQNKLDETNKSLETFEMALYAGEQAGDVQQVRAQIKDVIVSMEGQA